MLPVENNDSKIIKQFCIQHFPACVCFVLLLVQYVFLFAAVTFTWAVDIDSTANAATLSETSANQAMGKVRDCIQRGELDCALKVLTPFISEPERYPKLYSDYLVILVWSGRSNEALKRFESMPSVIPRRSYLLRNMAQAYSDIKTYGKAVHLYQRILNHQPDDWPALKGLAEAQVNAGDPVRAHKVLQRYARYHLTSLDYKLLKAKLLIHQMAHIQAFIYYDALIERYSGVLEKIAAARDDLIAALPPSQQEILLLELKQRADQGDRLSSQFYALSLALMRRYREAVTIFEQQGLSVETIPDHRRYWIGWAYFKTGNVKKARKIFDTINKDNSMFLPAKLGQIYCQVAQQQYAETDKALESLQQRYPNNLEVHFAQAYRFEKQAKFWDAIQVYDRILSFAPDNWISRRLRLRALSDMGASSLAQASAERELPTDLALKQSIEDDLGIDRLRWEEYDRATQILQPLAKQSSESRYRFDYIASLAKGGRHDQAAIAFERLMADGVEPPSWLKETVAGSYAVIKKTHKALMLYEQALVENPLSLEARMGKFYMLQELRRWQEAEALLQALDNDTPAIKVYGSKQKPNPEKLSLAVTRGWFLAAQNRLQDADRHFQRLYALAPANLEVRNGMAHVHLWRGWPRRSLQEFNIIEGLYPDSPAFQTGKISALNDLIYKNKARQEAAIRLKQRPHDIHVQNVIRSLSVEQMNEWRSDIQVQWEDGDTDDLILRQELSMPLTLKTRLFCFVLWQRMWDADAAAAQNENAAYYRRSGIGVDHIFNSDWHIRQSLSFNYTDGQDAGTAIQLDYTPADQWSFSVAADTYAAEVPRRARLKDIDAVKLGLDVTWRQSEWREASVSCTRSRFSDGNDRDEIFLGYQQNLSLKNDYRMRLYAEFYSGWNSKGDETVYFNPEQAWSLSLTHMIEQTVWQIHRRSFVYRLYVTAGNYQQKGFANAVVGGVRYEQVYEFSDCHYLQVGVDANRSVYDGESVFGNSFDLTYQWRF